MIIDYSSGFKKKFKKIKDGSFKTHLKKQIKKIIENPGIGKPMRFGRKGTRELYLKPFRIAYSCEHNKIIFLDIYHKKKQ